MAREIRITLRTADKNKAVVYISGYINMNTIEIFNKKIASIKKEFHPKKYIFYMSKVEYISSAGMGVFMDLFESIENKGGKVCFIKMPDVVRRVFELVGFLQYFGDVNTRKEAENYIQ
ncbi:MAG: STAS domain-containing protein [Spirochaetes bacterium]|nr:STAS domain-containing protein [Spirochaetota bacterium]